MKYAVVPLVLLFIVISLSVGYARPVKIWSYSEITKESTLIVIATFEESSDTEDKHELGGSPVVGVDSTFKVLSVLKGKTDGEVVVHHYKYDKSVTGVENGCRFAAFPKDDKSTYLLFLKEENEPEKIVPATGQYDAIDSFKVINNAKGALMSIH